MHPWQECRPAVLSLDGQESSDATVAVEMVWATLPDSDRRAFHRSCCYDSQASGDLAAMARIISAIKRRLEELGS